MRWTEELITSGAATRILTGAITREPDPAAATLRQDDAALTLARLAAAGEPSFTNPEWLRFLLFDNTGFSLADGQVVAPPDSGLAIRKALLTFFPDPQHAMAIASVNGNATLDELATGSRSVKDAVAAQGFEGADVIVTGTPTFLTDINDYLQEGMLTLGLIAVAVMLIVLAIVFRVRWRLLPMLAVLVGIVWGFGLFGYLGIDLSLVTIAGLPILIGVGVEFAIQVHNRVEEECVLDRDTNPFGETARELGPPMVVATVSAVISFLVMRISRVPMIQDFGVLLSIGIVMLLVTGIVVPLAVLGARERRRPTTEVRTGVTERILHWLGSLPSAAVVPLVVIAIVIPILGLVLERNSEIESDPINWADQSTDTVKNARQLEQDVNFATTLGIFIETSGHDENGIFTDQLAAFVHDFVARELEAEEATLVQASSLVSTVSYLIEVPGTTSLPPTGADVLEAYTRGAARHPATARRQQRERGPGPVPGRPLVVGGTGRPRRTVGDCDRPTRRRRGTAGQRGGDARRPCDRRRRPAQQPHGQPRGAHRRRTAARGGMARVPVRRPGPRRTDDDPRAPRGRRLGHARRTARHHAQPA